MSEPASYQDQKSASPQKALRVMHVDDMKQLCEIVKQSLERDGHVVESFSDGASALARVKEAPTAFDLFISDHHMPKMNGLEVVRELRRIDFKGKIFIYSSEIDEDVNAVYLTLKVDMVLPKPIVLPELKQLLADF
jgi:two-component system chemotaxis response regulator CheY